MDGLKASTKRHLFSLLDSTGVPHIFVLGLRILNYPGQGFDQAQEAGLLAPLSEANLVITGLFHPGG